MTTVENYYKILIYVTKVTKLLKSYSKKLLNKVLVYKEFTQVTKYLDK